MGVARVRLLAGRPSPDRLSLTRLSRFVPFCRKNGVQLPDEYDKIMLDLGPFRGLSPTALVRMAVLRVVA